MIDMGLLTLDTKANPQLTYCIIKWCFSINTQAKKKNKATTVWKHCLNYTIYTTSAGFLLKHYTTEDLFNLSLLVTYKSRAFLVNWQTNSTATANRGDHFSFAWTVLQIKVFRSSLFLPQEKKITPILLIKINAHKPEKVTNEMPPSLQSSYSTYFKA